LLEELSQKHTWLKATHTVGVTPGGGGVVLPIMAYTGRLRPKGVAFSGFRYMKG